MSYPDIDFSAEIISCLSLGGHYPQAERSRVIYLFDVIERSGTEPIWSEMVRQLDDEDDDTWVLIN